MNPSAWVAEPVFWLALGVILGAGFAGVMRQRGAERGQRLAAVGLAVAALVYVVAAAIGRAAGPLAVEGVGFAAFTAVAALGLRRPLLLAAGWVVHVGWDVGLHLVVEQSYIGAWYPTLCIGFDLVVAGFVAWPTTQKPSMRDLAPHDVPRP